MEPPVILVKRVSSIQPPLPLPDYATAGSAGFDLRADVGEDVVIAPLERAVVPTGLTMAVPTGYELQVRPRSGLAAKHGVTVLNSPGTIDSDYRGEVRVILVNLGQAPFRVCRGDRIAQAVLAGSVQAALIEVDCLDGTERGSGGFGSTGVD